MRECRVVLRPSALRFVGMVTSGLFLTSPWSAALAQQTPEKDSGDDVLQTITVTAQKREQNVEDVGIAITAVSGEQLRQLGVTNAQEVTAMAPGVSTIQPNGESNYSIAIRGVANSDFTTNVESPIALYVDDVYISQTSGAGFMLFDMDRVEILRGPQGTLFGRNATGGLVQYVTNRPTIDGFDGYGSISYGNYNRTRVEGAVNIPLASTLAARVSVATNQGDGYVTNLLTPGTKDNNANDTAARVQLLWKPNSDASLLLNARFGHEDIRTGIWKYVSAVNLGGTPTPGVPNPDLGGYVDNNPDPFTGSYGFQGHNYLTTKGYTATFKYQFGSTAFTSITDYDTVQRDYMEDTTASPVSYYNFFLTTNARQFSQELRLSGDVDKLNWVAGVYFLDLRIHDSNGSYAPGFFSNLASLLGTTLDAIGNTVDSPYTTNTKSTSPFGQLEYALTDRVSLIGGARWIDETKNFAYRNIMGNFPADVTSGADPRFTPLYDTIPPYFDSRHDKEWSARAQVNFKPVDPLLLYASWNRGVKSGGYNAPTSIVPEFDNPSFLKYDPEHLDAYEVGFKWDGLDHHLRIDGAAYYYNYKNYQAFSIISTNTFTLNSNSKNKGFELEVEAKPIQHLGLQAGVAYIDAAIRDVPGITEDIVTSGGTFPALRPGGTVTPVQTPKWNYNALVHYDIPVGPGKIDVEMDGVYRSRVYFSLLEDPATTEGGYLLANASIGWTDRDDKWSVRAWSKNLFNREYLLQGFDLSGTLAQGGTFGMNEKYYGQPRMYGVTVDYHFQ